MRLCARLPSAAFASRKRGFLFGYERRKRRKGSSTAEEAKLSAENAKAKQWRTAGKAGKRSCQDSDPCSSVFRCTEPLNHKQEVRRTPVRIIPLGGLNEIGKNMTVFECSNDMFILDCGLAFPDGDMPGVDIVIPDFTYVETNRDKVRGIVLTHGHEDHIGGLAYLLKKINVPVYGTKLTLGLVKGKLEEHGLANSVRLCKCSREEPSRWAVWVWNLSR